jgi:hypothetical protein
LASSSILTRLSAVYGMPRRSCSRIASSGALNTTQGSPPRKRTYTLGSGSRGLVRGAAATAVNAKRSAGKLQPSACMNYFTA